MATTLQTVNDRYGKYIWAIAKRYHTGIWDEEDVFQEMLLRIYSAMKIDRLPTGDDGESVRVVKSFIISKTIDILRVEIRRYMAHFDDECDDKFKAKSTESVEAHQLELKSLRELLSKLLPKQTAEFIYELAFPSPTTVEIAMEDRERLRVEAAAGKLKMDVHKLRVKPKHVAEWHRRGGNPPYTKQMIAKMRGEAQEALRGYFHMLGVADEDDVINELLR